MQRHELEHLIRAAGAITDEYEFVVVGSQSVLGSVDRPPADCLLSTEADLYPLNAEDKADLIDFNIGEGSPFHDTHGYYAQGVDSRTAVLPSGWRTRLVRLQTESTGGRVAYCLDVLDLFLSKCVANREKDRVFNRTLLAHGLVREAEALARLHELPISEVVRADIAMLIRRLARDSSAEAPSTPPG
ncbi:MAG: hypothetical protein J0H09_18615 [Burkholderiales bacterium]|nr:hypothetical protein [Burkholderiales bacterium]